MAPLVLTVHTQKDSILGGMANGRGRARDTLSDSEATTVRKRLRQARDAKGLSNADIAMILGWKRGQIAGDWTPQKVARVLDRTGRDTETGPRPLRAPNALAVMYALVNAPVRGFSVDEAANRTMRALRLVNAAATASLMLRAHWIGNFAAVPERQAEALIPHGEEDGLAQFLVDRMAERGGYGTKRRDSTLDDLKHVLRTHSGELAQSAAAVYRTRFRGWEQQHRAEVDILRAFQHAAPVADQGDNRGGGKTPR